MKLVADLHIHSHYSRATSKDLTFEHLSKWAQFKGVQVVGTGDIAHPGWLQEIHEKLEPAETGLFRLKPAYAAAVQADVPPACQSQVRFLLAGEISNIYKKGDKTRKVHNVVFAPTLAAVERIQARLEKIGNIRSDGRPILGLDSRDLLEIILEVDERCHLIPAHIWTPWFSMLGSMSGFDSVEECFDDLTPHIFALETGLSSDPPMNWRVSNLDRYTLVSNSDAHSPPKLAREATLFDTELSYDALFAALRTGDPATFKGTIEFFPEEGKYHLDGHRKCGVCWEPPDTLAHENRCIVCGRPVTVGVMHRVEKLADRGEGGRPERVHPFHSLVPLPEILAELNGVGAGSKRVTQEYFRLLGRLGPELTILLDAPLESIEAAGGLMLAQGIDRMRRGQVLAIGGYDGEFGVVKLFSGAAAEAADPQITLFEVTTIDSLSRSSTPLAAPEPIPQTQESEQPESQQALVLPHATPPNQVEGLLSGLNAEQRQAVLCTDTALVIVAGPGTGKTRTLTVRIANLIRTLGASPGSVLAITFTNKAANEMAERLTVLLDHATASLVTVKTFHAFGAQLLREFAADAEMSREFAILRDVDRLHVLRKAAPELDSQTVDAASRWISMAKNQLLGPDDEQLIRYPWRRNMAPRRIPPLCAGVGRGPSARRRRSDLSCRPASRAAAYRIDETTGAISLDLGG